MCVSLIVLTCIAYTVEPVVYNGDKQKWLLYRGDLYIQSGFCVHNCMVTNLGLELVVACLTQVAITMHSTCSFTSLCVLLKNCSSPCVIFLGKARRKLKFLKLVN